MKAIDTNLLVRLLTRDDPAQTERAETFIAQGAWVSHLVLVETIWVLESVYDLKSKSLATAITMLLNHARLSIQNPDVVKSALVVFQKYPSVDFSDCLILNTAQFKGHTPLGTFDKAFSKIDGTIRI